MTDREAPLVSVVVPFYNTAEYLETCVRSVLLQDYAEFELILSDNCSDDGSSRIARRLARSDDRIRYVPHDEFVGQVANYNRALTEISSDSVYTKIVQADDWVYPESLRKMAGVADRHRTAGLVSSYTLKGTSVKNVGLPPDRELFTGREICRRQLLEGQFFVGSPTTVMYRSEIVRERSPFYSEKSLHEDTEACYEILREWDLGFVHQVLSFARTRAESISAEGEEHDPHLLDKLILIDRYGDDFLTPEEHRSVWKRYSRRYYDFLGLGLLGGRGDEFWDYHREGLATIGRRIRKSKVVAGALRTLASLLLNPLDTGRLVAERVAGLFRTSAAKGDVGMGEADGAADPVTELPPLVARRVDE